MKKLIILFLFGTQGLAGFAQENPEGLMPRGDTRPYALVAGGSKGIGYGIAEALARRGYNLILIARHLDTLQKAKRILENSYSIHVEILTCDLSFQESAGEIADWCIKRNIQLKVLCNVAGFGGSRDYLSLSLDSLRYMIRLNVESCMALSLTLLPLLEKNAPAYILNVASGRLRAHSH
jgi:short-subunit dehydrogenase